MKFIVLGASAAYAGPGEACSGYLIEEGNTRILLDCGTGVVSNLFNWLDPCKLNAMVISHLHPDHFLDIYPLRYYYQFDATVPSFSLRTLAPDKSSDFLGSILSDSSKKEFAKFFRFEDINDKISYKFNDFELRFKKVKHCEPTYAIAINGKKRLVYSADTGYSEGLVEFTEGADAFICEATLQEAHAGAQVDHLTAKQAAMVARKGGVKKLFLTHIWPGCDGQVSLKEAKEVYDGEVILLSANKLFEI
ncbi:MAG TPA: MBL fold metallo-hydrolase [Actinobacteria bacterium]|nr:MBL fold metallo-hydrolase [Actinomycetota bacterium]